MIFLSSSKRNVQVNTFKISIEHSEYNPKLKLLEQFEIESRGKNPKRRLFRCTAGSHITYLGSKWQCIKYLVSLTSLDLMWTKLIIKKLIRHRFWLKGRLVIILTGNRTCVRSINSKGSVRRIVITSHFTEEKKIQCTNYLNNTSQTTIKTCNQKMKKSCPAIVLLDLHTCHIQHEPLTH